MTKSRFGNYSGPVHADVRRNQPHASVSRMPSITPKPLVFLSRAFGMPSDAGPVAEAR
jgi:hypothetical protein